MISGIFIYFNSIIEPKDQGIKSPSPIAKRFPKFDIIHGYLFEFFHKLFHVFFLLLPLRKREERRKKEKGKRERRKGEERNMIFRSFRQLFGRIKFFER